MSHSMLRSAPQRPHAGYPVAVLTSLTRSVEVSRASFRLGTGTRPGKGVATLGS